MSHMSEEKALNHAENSPSKWLAGGGVIAGLISFVGASCCVLPILLVNAGVSTALVVKLGFFARYQHWFQWGGIALLVAGYLFAFRNGRPNTRVLFMLAAGSVFVVSAYFMPSFEGDLLRWITRR